MHFPERIYGVENEFGVMREDASGRFTKVDTGSVRKGIDPIVAFLACATLPDRMWHTNGSCTYVDTGEHPEHATCECRSVRDAVLYVKAGEFLAADIFSNPFDNASPNF